MFYVNRGKFSKKKLIVKKNTFFYRLPKETSLLMVVWVGFPFSQEGDKAALSSWFPHTLFGVSSVITEASPNEPRRNSIVVAKEKATRCGRECGLNMQWEHIRGHFIFTNMEEQFQSILSRFVFKVFTGFLSKQHSLSYYPINCLFLQFALFWICLHRMF